MTVDAQSAVVIPLPRIETKDAAEALCSGLHQTVAELVALLDRETAVLRSGKPQDIAALQVRKSALSAELARDMTALKQDAEFIRMATPERVESLQRQQALLEKSLETNQEALAAMKSVSELLLRTIASKVAERRAGPETYGGNAALSNAPATVPSAISVDSSL